MAMKMARLKCYNKAMRLYVPDPKSKLKKFPTIDNSHQVHPTECDVEPAAKQNKEDIKTSPRINSNIK